ncbi:MAG: hypothetical protein K2N78_09965 [Oscillospiraceae bacterium]|nr:hypothetical protein [Oscillospiraceae bacterium]
MKNYDGYSWEKRSTAIVEPGKPIIGGFGSNRFDSPEKHPLLSINNVGRTIEPPYLILAMEV